MKEKGLQQGSPRHWAPGREGYRSRDLASLEDMQGPVSPAPFHIQGN